MSLNKILALPSAHEVSYWRVLRVAIEPIEKIITIRYGGYRSQADFDAGAAPAVQRRVRLLKDDYIALTIPDVISDTRKWLKLVDKIVAASVPQLNDALIDSNDIL